MYIVDPRITTDPHVPLASAVFTRSRIIFKFGMKVRYGKAKTPIVFGVGGVIVPMVTFFVEIF